MTIAKGLTVILPGILETFISRRFSFFEATRHPLRILTGTLEFMRFLKASLSIFGVLRFSSLGRGANFSPRTKFLDEILNFFLVIGISQ